jgi:peptide deformylase
MALRDIITGEDDILHKTSRSVTVFDGRLFQLLDDMAETLHNANGAGLAAVQVGILRRVVVVDVGEGVVELINPEITERSEETVTASEACLSFPGEAGKVERPQKVTVRAQSRSGDVFTVTGEDLLARALCHEIDHTNGVVFKDLAISVYANDEDEDEDEDGEE